MRKLALSFAIYPTLFVSTALAQPATPPSASAPATRPASTRPATSKAVAAAKSSRSAAGKRLQVLFTADIYGRYAWPGCRKRTAGRAELSHLVTAVETLRKQAVAAGQGKPVVVVGGSTIRPDILGNFVFRDAASLVPKVADLFARARFDAVSVGLFDFGAATRALRRFGRALRSRKIPLLAGNVSCARAGDFRCQFLGGMKRGKRYVLAERNGVRIAIVGVVREDLKRLVLKRAKGSLDVAEPVSWTRKMIRQLRGREKVDLVIALANLNLESNAPKPILDYARALGDDAPDIIVANAMYERGSAGYLRQIRRGRTLIVGTDRFGRHLGRVALDLSRVGGRWRVAKASVEQIEVRKYAPDKRARKTTDLLMAALCKEVDQQLGKGYFRRPISYKQFLDYMMEVMRKRTRSEVAVINDSAIADTSFPMGGRLTWEKLLRAIRTETNVGYVALTGARLKALLGAHAKKPTSGLHVLGLVYKKKSWLVNGRPLLKEYSYRVASTAFVASGGDGLLALRKKRERFSSLGVSLRDLATDFFGADGEASYDRETDVGPGDFPDLGKKWLLYGDLDVGFGLSTVSVSNGADNARYSLPLLRRDDVVILKGNIDASIGASTRDHALELDVSLNYGKTWTTVKTEDLAGSGFRDETTAAESIDRITATFIYKLRMLTNAYGNRWYMPEPYSELRLITEFSASGECAPTDCPDPGDQIYHYLDLGGTAGLGLTLHPLFFAKLGFSMRGELLTPKSAKPDIRAKPGIYLGYLLRRWKIVADPLHPLELESRLDFYFSDFGGQLRRELTLQSKLYFSLTRWLALTLGHALYYFDKRCQNNDTQCLRQGDEAAVANDVTVGLALRLDFRRQTF